MLFRSNGVISDSEIVNAGESPKNVPEATKAGHKFIGWKEAGGEDVYTEKALKKISVTKNMKFIAQFEAIEAEKVIVTYEADGIIKAVETVDKGSKPKNVPENPTKKDHTFMGWQKNGTGVLYEKKAVEALTINEDTDFIANFKEGINVIPGDEPKPPEYVTVTFDKGK